MDNIVNLVIAPSMLGGFTGVQDCLNPQYKANAMQSLWATPEQNKKLEESLMEIYKIYLEDVASRNNGIY